MFKKLIAVPAAAAALTLLLLACSNGSNKPASASLSRDETAYDNPESEIVSDATEIESSLDDMSHINSEKSCGEVSDESITESSEETPEESAECVHKKGYETVIKPYDYYEDGLTLFVCPDCGFSEDIATTKVTINGKTKYTYAEMEAVLGEFSRRYGNVIRTESIGFSAEGRNLYACEFGDPDADFHILIGAAMHGKEYMNTALLLDLIEFYILESDETYLGAPLSDYIKNVCFHIIPMINPDGVTISQTQSASDKVARFLLDRGITSPDLKDYYRVWKSNANGIDLNRNFPAGWDEYIDTVAVPNYRLYKGEHAGSEPETKALMAYTLKYGFNATISYHSYGEIIYWNYGGDEALLSKSRSLAKSAAAVTGYQPVHPENEVAAGYKDWAMSRGIPSITLETGKVASPLPESEYARIWNENRNIFAAVAAWVKDN